MQPEVGLASRRGPATSAASAQDRNYAIIFTGQQPCKSSGPVPRGGRGRSLGKRVEKDAGRIIPSANDAVNSSSTLVPLSVHLDSRKSHVVPYQ